LLLALVSREIVGSHQEDSIGGAAASGDPFASPVITTLANTSIASISSSGEIIRLLAEVLLPSLGKRLLCPAGTLEALNDVCM